MLIGVVAIPYILGAIGKERLGLLTLIWALIGYFSIFDFGLGRALTQKIASFASTNALSERDEVAKAGLSITLLTGLFGASTVIVSAIIFGTEGFNAAPIYKNELNYSIYLTALAIPITTLTTGYKGILEGLERFKSINLYRLVLGLSNFISPIIAIQIFGPRLDMIVFALVLSRLFILILHKKAVQKIMNIRIEIRIMQSNNLKKDLLKFGSWMTLSNILSPLMVVSDRFFISNMLGASVVAFYTIPSEFLLKILLIPASLTSTLFPLFSKMLTCDLHGTLLLYKKSIIVIFAIIFSIIIILYFFLHTIFGLWLGSEFADKAYEPAIIMMIGILFNSMAQVPFALIQANGEAKITSLLHLVEIVIYIPVLLISIKNFGLNGAAMAWSFRAFLDFLFLNIYALKIVKVVKGR